MNTAKSLFESVNSEKTIRQVAILSQRVKEVGKVSSTFMEYVKAHFCDRLKYHMKIQHSIWYALRKKGKTFSSLLEGKQR